MMRKISVSLAVVMLLVLSAPVLTYAASILKLQYDAITGEISGVIYSDQRDISLSLDLGGGQEVPVDPGVVGEVYHSSSSNVYWAEVNGAIGAGLAPGQIKVRAGDERLVPASVTGSTYTFNGRPLIPSPQMYWDRQYDFYEKGTQLYLYWSTWQSGWVFGLSHYNVYDNNELLFKTTDDNTIPYFSPYSPVYPYHSFHKLQVSAVDWLGHETEKSAPLYVRAPGVMKDARASFSGAKAGSSLQPLANIVSFTPSSERLTEGTADEFKLKVQFTYGMDADFNAVPFTLNDSEITASDFELVKSDGTVIPAATGVSANRGVTLTFQKQLDSSATYTLRMSGSASGNEITLPQGNTRNASVNLSLETMPDYATSYRFNAYILSEIGTFPDRPTGLKATPGDGTLLVSWNNNTEPDLAGYLVWLNGKLLTASPIQKTSFFIDGLKNGQNYHVNVAAVNKDGGRSLQAFIFPAPNAPSSGEPGNPGPGNGGPGNGDSSPPVKNETIAAAPPLLATLVDKNGVSKTVGAALTSENGRVRVSAGDHVKVLLPATGGELLNKENTLVIDKADFSLSIPGQVLEQLQGLVSAEQLKTSQIAVGFSPISATELAEDIARASDKTVDTVITPAGAALNVTLTLVTADGKENRLSKFNLPVTLKLSVGNGSDASLTGVYNLDELGGMQYLGGRLSDGMLIVDTDHLSKYAVLQYDKTFADVPAGHWASPAIKAMVAQHVATGISDSRFSPNQAVTRAEFAAFIARSLNLKAAGETEFTDVPQTKWYSDAVAAVVETGIANGQSSTTFAPERAISREEMVVMLMKAYAYKYMLPFNVGDEGVPFNDHGQISTWAKAYAATAHRLELVQGNGGGKLEPHKQATRAEAVQLISKL